MNAFFVTGSSGAGKSTLVKELRQAALSNVAVYDFDELGVPLDADQSWRIATTRQWLDTSKDNAAKGVTTVVLGLTHPAEVDAIAREVGITIRYCMLEVESEELKRRLLAYRFSTPERVGNLQKYGGVTPEQFFENNERHVAQIRAEAIQQHAYMLDTTHLTPQQVCLEIIDWLHAAK